MHLLERRSPTAKKRSATSPGSARVRPSAGAPRRSRRYRPAARVSKGSSGGGRQVLQQRRAAGAQVGRCSCGNCVDPRQRGAGWISSGSATLAARPDDHEVVPQAQQRAAQRPGLGYARQPGAPFALDLGADRVELGQGLADAVLQAVQLVVVEPAGAGRPSAPRGRAPSGRACATRPAASGDARRRQHDERHEQGRPRRPAPTSSTRIDRRVERRSYG